MDQLWDWFWAAAPTSIRQYHSKLPQMALIMSGLLHCFALRTSKGMTCLLDTALSWYIMPKKPLD